VRNVQLPVIKVHRSGGESKGPAGSSKEGGGGKAGNSTKKSEDQP